MEGVRYEFLDNQGKLCYTIIGRRQLVYSYNQHVANLAPGQHIMNLTEYIIKIFTMMVKTGAAEKFTVITSISE